MIDSHCHLAGEEFVGRSERGRRSGAGCRRHGGACILSAGDWRNASGATRVREAWPAVRFAAGVHPHQAGDFAGRVAEACETVPSRRQASTRRARSARSVSTTTTTFRRRDVQRTSSGRQVEVAVDLGCRSSSTRAKRPTTRSQILRDAGEGRLRGVFHCFTGDEAMARTALEIGFLLVVCRHRDVSARRTIRAAARMAPPDRSSPRPTRRIWLRSPTAASGMNRPMSHEVVAKLAEVRSVPGRPIWPPRSPAISSRSLEV